MTTGEAAQGWWNRDWRDEAERRSPGLAYVAVMGTDSTDWDRLMGKLFELIDRHGVDDYVRFDKTRSEVVSRLGVEAAKRPRHVSPGLWVDMRGQERRLLRVDLSDTRFSGHRLRGRTFAGTHHTRWWSRATNGPGSLLSWNRARIIDETVKTARWDESRIEQGWRDRDMTEDEMFEWLGLVTK